MAKKEKFTSGNFDLDSDLDIGNFDFGDSSHNKQNEKSRSPVMKTASNFAKGSIGGLKSAATNSATIAKAIRAGMPKEYGDVMDRSGEVTSQLSSLYNDANAKLKPELQKIAKQMDKLVPEEMKRTKGVLGKIKKALGVDDRSSSYSEEDANEGMIQGQLAEVFSVQAEDTIKSRAEDRAERKLDKKVDAKRFESSFGLLNSINVNMARMAGYTTKVNNAFQKKSLELQYRSYFIQQDMLKTSKAMMAMLDERTANIQKNTGLPDFVKRNISEDFKEMTRRKMLGSAGGFLARGLKNVAQAGKSKIGDYAFMLQQASMGLDMATDAKDMMKTQKEMNESMGIADTGKAGMVGDMAGGLAMEKMIKKLGLKINKKYFQQGSKQSNFLFNMLSMLNNGEQETRKFQSKHLQQDFSATGLKGNAKNFAKGGLSDFIDLFLKGGHAHGGFDKQMGSGLSKLHESAEFNQMTQKSIVTIIPGFLSRIHGELQSIRSGSKAPPAEYLQYDSRSGKFAMSTEVARMTKRHLQKTVNDNGLSYGIDKIHDQISSGTNLSKEASEALRKKLHSHVFNNNGLDVEDLKHDDFTKGMSAKHAKEIRGAIGQRYNKDDAGYASRRSELTKAGRDARSSIGNLDQEIQSLIDAGQESTLLKLRVIKRTESGFVIAKDAARKLSEAGFEQSGRFKTSDVTAKTNIKGVSGSKALQAIKKTKIYNWLYKSGKGDNQAHTGPMAQDVNRELGDGAAPKGKALDLLTMNGVNMAATQELEKQVKQVRHGKGSTSQVSILSSISRNTAAIVQRLDAMAHLSFGIPKLDTKGLQDGLKKYGSKISDAMESGRAFAGEKLSAASDKISGMEMPKGLSGHMKNVVISSGAILGSIISKAFNVVSGAGQKLGKGLTTVGETAKDTFAAAKDPAKSAGKWFFEKGTLFAGKVFDSVTNAATDILQNKLPKGWDMVLKGAGWLGGKTKDLIDPPKDIYVNGQQQPALRAIIMRGGGYFDQISKKPIKRPSDIKGPVVDHEGNIVLSVDDIEKGIHDAEGKPIESIMGILKNIGANVTGFVTEKAGNFLSKFKGLGGKAGGKLKDIGSGISNRLGIGGGVKVVNLLTQIRDVLNTRLPGKRMKFASVEKEASPSEPSGSSLGSMATSAASAVSATASNVASAAGEAYEKGKENISKAAEQIKQSKFGTSIGGMFGKLGGFKKKAGAMLSEKFGQVKDKLQGENREGFVGPKKPGLLSRFMRGVGGLFGRKSEAATDTGREAETDPDKIHAKEGEREGNTNEMFEKQAAREAKRKKDTKVAVADPSARYKSDKNIFDVMTEKAQGAFGDVMSGLGSLAQIVFGGKLGMLGKGISALGSVAGTAGRLALGGIARIGVGNAIAAAGTMAGGFGGAAMAVGGMAMTAGSALLGALFSPVGLGLAATAAVGYGLFKGYKFLTRNKATPEAMVRMMQYGLRTSESSHYHLLYQLESTLLESGVVFRNNMADIDKQKVDLEKVLEIFDLTEETANTPQGQNFTQWFSRRFKTVFLNHLTALRAVDSKLSLAEIDKLKDKDVGKFDRYFKVAANTPGVYENSESPFSDLDQLRATQKDVQDAVKAIRDEYRDQLDKDGNVKEGLFAGAAKKAWSFMTKNEGLDKAAAAGGIRGALASVMKALPGVAMAKNILDGAVSLAGQIGVGIKRFLNSALTALESVRFKTYGLKKFRHNQVSSIRNLEDTVSAMVSFNGAQAVFKGDIGEVIKSVGSDFGLSSPADDHASSWTTWFSKRFLPVFLNFLGSGNQLSGKKKADEIEGSLKEGQKYDLAVRLSGTNNVWSEDISPWKDDPDLCTASSDCADNLQYLKDKAGEEVLADPKAQAAKKAADTKSVKSKMFDDPDKLVGWAPTGAGNKNTNTGSGSTTEGESAKNGQSIQSRAETILQTKIPLAFGERADPAEGDQYLKLDKGARLDGVNPEMLRNLKMMAAEYGKATGKSIVINSGARTTAEQAELYRQDPKKAAKPGMSLHEFGLALDVNTEILNDLEKLGLMRKYGFTRPVGGESWHMEPAGIQKNIDLAKKDSSFASEAIQNSLGLGGGGYGVVANSAKGHRNSSLAASLLDDSVSASISGEDKNASKDGSVKPSAKAPAPATAATAKSAPAAPTKSPTETASAQILTREPGKSPTLVASADSNKTFGRLDGFTETEPGSLAKSNTSDQPGDVKSIIADAAKQTGVDPNTLLAFAAVESSLNPAAKASKGSATGLYQFVDGTWKDMIGKYGRKYGLDASASPTDPRANALMGGEYLKENMKTLSSVKSNPGATDLYISHFLGGPGSRKFFNADPNAIAAEVLPDAAKSNRPIFYDGQHPRTISQVYTYLNNKLHNTASHYGITLPSGDGFSGKTQLAQADTSGPRARTASGFDPTPSTVPPSRITPPPVSRTQGAPTVMSGQAMTTLPQPSQTPILPPPPPSPGVMLPSPMPTAMPSNMNIGGSDPALSNIDDTLTQSLAVQMRMLEYLQQIAKSAQTTGNATQMDALVNGLGLVVNTLGGKGQGRQGPVPVPASPISLERRTR